MVQNIGQLFVGMTYASVGSAVSKVEIRDVQIELPYFGCIYYRTRSFGNPIIVDIWFMVCLDNRFSFTGWDLR